MISMPLPFIPLVVAAGAAVATAVAGKKDMNHIKYEGNKRYCRINRKALQNSFNTFDNARQSTNTQFEKYGELKLNILNGTMKEFISEFKKLKMLILQIKLLSIPLKMYLILNVLCRKLKNKLSLHLIY